MKFNCSGSYNARKHGGLFLGIRVHFPITICDDNNINYTWRNTSLNIGLVVYTLNIEINYAHKYINFN
jgi:hypothetical protein